MTKIPVTEKLGTCHNRHGFSCGEPLLDLYLKQYAAQDQKRRVAAVFVLAGAQVRIKGYYSLSQANIAVGDIPEPLARKMPRHSFLPATLLGRLAVDQAYQGQGIGETLLMDALYRSYLLSAEAGSIAVLVDALNEAGVRFYERYGFISLKGMKKLFLPMKTIGKLF